MNNLNLKHLEVCPENFQKVQWLLESAPSYCLKVSGMLAQSSDGEDVFKALPSSFPRENKKIMGLYLDDEMIGVVDYLLDYPAPETVHIGLLLIGENYQNQGLGKKIYLIFEQYLIRTINPLRLRLAVVETNLGVLDFWKKMGFTQTGEVKPFKNKDIESNAMILFKDLGKFD